MLSQEKFKKLMNGGASLAGVKGLSNEIQALEAEMESARAELCEMPARRAKLIMEDDTGEKVDALELRERTLERLLERNGNQVPELRQRLVQLRHTELRPKIARHHAILRKHQAEIEKAVAGVLAANTAARAALKDALADELGDVANCLPSIEFGIGDDSVLHHWNNFQTEQWLRVERATERLGMEPVAPVSPLDLSNLAEEFAGRTAFKEMKKGLRW